MAQPAKQPSNTGGPNGGWRGLPPSAKDQQTIEMNLRSDNRGRKLFSLRGSRPLRNAGNAKRRPQRKQNRQPELRPTDPGINPSEIPGNQDSPQLPEELAPEETPETPNSDVDSPNSDSTDNPELADLESSPEDNRQSVREVPGEKAYNTPGNEASSPDPQELSQAERAPGRPGSSSSSTRPGRTNSSSGNQSSSQPGKKPTTSAAAPGKQNNDTSSPRSLYRPQNSNPTNPGRLNLGNLFPKLGTLFGNRRRAFLGSTGIVATIIGLMFGFSVASGPAMLIHYAQVLSKSFSHQDNASESRMRGLYKWARTGDVGETRLSLLGSKLRPVIDAKLAKQGLTVDRGKYTGQLRSMTLDSSKNPLLSGLGDEEARALIAQNEGVTADRVAKISGIAGPEGKSSIFRVNYDGLKVSAKRGAVKDGFISHAIRSQSLNKITSAIQLRQYLNFIDARSFLHPLHNKITDAKSKIETKKILKDLDRERKARITARSEQAKVRASSIKGKLGLGAGVVSGVLLGTQAICVAKDIAGQIPDINRENITVPAMRSAADAIGLGAQIQAGQDIDPAQLNTVVQEMQDPKTGKSVWDAKAVQAQAGTGGATGAVGGEDIDPDVKQAFSPDSTATNISKSLDDFFGADELCSTAGQIIGTIGGVALLFIPGPGWVAKGLSASVGIAAITAITTIVPKLLADTPITGVPHQGPQGGNVDAYGAKELANSAFRSSAAVKLTAGQSSALKIQNDAQDSQDFLSKSVAQRIFDTHDYRSLVSRFIDSRSGGVGRNITKIASSVMDVNKWINSLSSIFLHKTYAAQNSSYDFGFPEYGFSQDDLNNPDLDDPYTNAEQVVNTVLPAHPEYIARAKKCFDVTISKGVQGWDAVAEGDVNPTGRDYNSVDCVDAGNGDWLRVRFFILDSHIMTSYSCYEGNNEICSEIGLDTPTAASGSTSGNSSTTSATGGASIIGDITQDSTSVPCADGTDEIGNFDGYTSGQKIPIKLCAVKDLPVQGIDGDAAESVTTTSYGNKFYIKGADGRALVNSRVSGAVVAMVKAAKASSPSVSLIALSSFRTNDHQKDSYCQGDPACKNPNTNYAEPGKSSHQLGAAIDFLDDNRNHRANCDRSGYHDSSGKCISPSSPIWKWLDSNAGTYHYQQLKSESWHWSPSGN